MIENSKVKKIIFINILIVFGFIAIEVALHALYFAAKREPFPFHSYRSVITRIATGDAELTPVNVHAGELSWAEGPCEVVHPYLGFVFDPSQSSNVSYLGFPQKDDDPFLQNSSNVLVIAILGGSFAQEVSIFGREALQSTLLEHGIASRVLTLSMGGYKQPQQLMTLAWLLSLNAPIDIVINIDGFNEVALPQAENIPKGVNPFYPRAWYLRTANLTERDSLRLIGEGAILSRYRKTWANIFDHPALFSRSIIINLAWKITDRFMEREIRKINRTLLTKKSSFDSSFLTTGPKEKYTSGDQLYRNIAAHWRSCSVLMDSLCKSRNILYMHFLQPNQYYEAGNDFTRLTQEELKTVYRKDHPYRPGVVLGYPRLIAEGTNLLSNGIDFHDLTFVYYNIKEAIYRDDCGHPNNEGYEIVSKHIAHAIISKIEANKDRKNISQQEH